VIGIAILFCAKFSSDCTTPSLSELSTCGEQPPDCLDELCGRKRFGKKHGGARLRGDFIGCCIRAATEENNRHPVANFPQGFKHLEAGWRSLHLLEEPAHRLRPKWSGEQRFRTNSTEPLTQK
jgi:hypothetical protein